jgi:hypothetical protein
VRLIRCADAAELRWGPGRRARDDRRRAGLLAQKIRFLGEVTQAPMRALVDPFLLMFLLICSAYPVFDTWHITVLEVVLLCTFAAALIIAALLLRNATEVARRSTLTRLRDLSDAARRPRDREALAGAVAEVEQAQQGAFAGFTHNPLLHALSIPVGGFGGLALVETLVKTL